MWKSLLISLILTTNTLIVEKSVAAQLKKFEINGFFENITYPEIINDSEISIQNLKNGRFIGTYTLDVDNNPTGFNAINYLNDWNIDIKNKSGNVIKRLSSNRNEHNVVFSAAWFYYEYSGNPYFTIPKIRFSEYDYLRKIGHLLELAFPINSGANEVFNGSSLLQSSYIEINNKGEFYTISSQNSYVQIAIHNKSIPEPRLIIGLLALPLLFTIKFRQSLWSNINNSLFVWSQIITKTYK